MILQITNRLIRIVAIAVLIPFLASCSHTASTGTVGWDSGELQTQIGDKNKNKKKLVMRVWYSYKQVANGTYNWTIDYSIKAENHNLVGSGWHTVGELASFTFTASIVVPGQGSSTIYQTVDLTNQSSKTGTYLYNTIALPNFISKSATGSRYGGASGISITWP